jgi:hypothetical protein
LVTLLGPLAVLLVPFLIPLLPFVGIAWLLYLLDNGPVSTEPNDDYQI